MEEGGGSKMVEKRRTSFMDVPYLSAIKTYAVLEVWVKAQQQTPVIMTVKTMKIATIAGVDLKGAKKYSPPSFSMV